MSVTPEREAGIFNAARKLPVGERAFYLEGGARAMPCCGSGLRNFCNPTIRQERSSPN
jgi:hypothetical protein